MEEEKIVEGEGKGGEEVGEEGREAGEREEGEEKSKTERQEKYPAHILYFAAKYNYFSTTII